MNKSLIYLFGIFLILAIAGSIFLKGGSPTGNVINNSSSGEVQNLILGLKNYNYYPNTVTVNANQPVRISLDSSVVGCLRDFTIPEFKMHKYLKTPQDYIEFTPTTPGTYRFACSMGMGTGTIIVK